MSDQYATVLCYKCRRTIRRVTSDARAENGVVKERERFCTGVMRASCLRVQQSSSRTTTTPEKKEEK